MPHAKKKKLAGGRIAIQGRENRENTGQMKQKDEDE